MRTRASLTSLAPLLALALVAGACGEDAPTTGDEENIAETRDLFGDDRVADAVAKDLDKAPAGYAATEKLFGIGRECKRTDSKEIYVVEESSSRAGGVQESTDKILPRAIVTGCNTNPSDPNSAIQSFGLMVALFSSPDAEDADEGDPMILDPVEIMALDRRTGLYNFYVFEANGRGEPATISRFQLLPDGDVVEYRKEPGKKMETVPRKDKACHNCHANMGPLMNEMHEPWTNWVSTHKTLPESELSGETESIVSEAAGNAFANDLEPTMETAIRVWVEGLPGVAGSGFTQAAIDGDQPQRLKGLMKSVFCETELQYASTADVVPLELFVDPAAVAGADFIAPSAYSADRFPILMPVRSDMDKRIETSLIKKKYLSLNTTIAIRLLDQDNDIFSAKRCGVLPKVVSKLPEEPAKVDAHVAAAVREAALAGLVPAGTALDYLKALTDPAATSDVRKAAKAAYFEQRRVVFAEQVAKFETVEGRNELRALSQARKDAAVAMFPGERNPRPILPPEEPEEVSGGTGGGTGQGGGGTGGGGTGGGGTGGGDPVCQDPCVPGPALVDGCDACATAVCDADDFCCTTEHDATCVGIAQNIPACACN